MPRFHPAPPRIPSWNFPVSEVGADKSGLAREETPSWNGLVTYRHENSLTVFPRHVHGGFRRRGRTCRRTFLQTTFATPDHTHAAIAMAALKAGKHVYCQKPLSHNIYEARLLGTTAAEAMGCVAVMENQHHSSAGARKVVEWVRAGLIGDVTRAIGWCSLTDSSNPVFGSKTRIRPAVVLPMPC